MDDDLALGFETPLRPWETRRAVRRTSVQRAIRVQHGRAVGPVRARLELQP